jgi:HAD superfamily hydrolase (TIGR01509 family)
LITTILFDLDNVLMLTSDIHRDAFNDAIKKVAGFQLSEDEYLQEFNGLPTNKKIDILISQGRLTEALRSNINMAKQEFTMASIRTNVTFDTQKFDLLARLSDMGLRFACVTNSSRQSAELILELSGIMPWLDITITNEDVAKSKPDPEPYLRAMQALGVTPQECLIVEDSPFGLMAARATGAQVMAVAGPHQVTIENIMRYLV